MRRPARVAALASTLALSTLVAGCGFLGIGGEEPGDIQVYSARHYDLEEAFVEFEEETGLKVDFIYGDDAELLERIKAEGEDGPADVYMTVDAGNLWNAAEQDELAPLDSQVLDGAVPEAYRDPENRWFGLAAARPHRRLQPRHGRPRRSSTPRTPTPASPTRSGRAGCACATPPRPTPSRWSPA